LFHIFKIIALIKGKEMVTILVALLFVSALLPEMVTQVQTVNTTAWTFTGATGASTLWQLTPFIVIAGIVIAILDDLIRGT
jgi:hypothetical protein